MIEPRIVVVRSPYGNAFFEEVAIAIVAALRARGVDAIVTTEPDTVQVSPTDVFVLVPPHEYVNLEGADFVADPLVAARTIGVSAEQPSDEFFELNLPIARQLGAVFDFSAFAVEAFARHGVVAHHLPFGYVPSWDRCRGRFDGRQVTTPLLYLGNNRPRRLGVLADAAEALDRHDATLFVSDTLETNTRTTASFLAGDDKRRLLATTGWLINIHQGSDPYFEWLRFNDAAHCGAAVLSEPSIHDDPFRADVHYLTFDDGQLANRIDELVPDRDRQRAIAAAAYDELRSQPLERSVGSLIEVARDLLSRPAPRRLPARTRTAALGRRRVDPAPRARWRQRRGTIRKVTGRRRGHTLVAPGSIVMRESVDALAAQGPLVTFVVDGLDAEGRPMLEGVWPWEPWRLANGQHLGRAMIVDDDLLAAATRWISEPWVVDQPHLAVQLFAVVHGVAATHVPRPVGSLVDTVVDPGQQLPPGIADRVRELLVP